MLKGQREVAITKGEAGGSVCDWRRSSGDFLLLVICEQPGCFGIFDFWRQAEDFLFPRVT